MCKEASLNNKNSINDMCGECYRKSLEDPSDEVKNPCMVILDFSNEQCYYKPKREKVEVTKENVLELINGLKEGKLEKEQF